MRFGKGSALVKLQAGMSKEEKGESSDVPGILFSLGPSLRGEKAISSASPLPPPPAPFWYPGSEPSLQL